jgi:hypothetical protein
VPALHRRSSLAGAVLAGLASVSSALPGPNGVAGLAGRRPVPACRTKAHGLRRTSVMEPNTHLRDHADEPPAELISGVLNDARDLATAEIDRLKAEVKDVGDQVKIASAGFLILTVGAVLMGVAVALGLAALGVPAWLAFGIVAIVFGIAGIVFLKKRRAIAKAT